MNTFLQKKKKEEQLCHWYSTKSESGECHTVKDMVSAPPECNKAEGQCSNELNLQNSSRWCNSVFFNEFASFPSFRIFIVLLLSPLFCLFAYYAASFWAPPTLSGLWCIQFGTNEFLLSFAKLFSLHIFCFWWLIANPLSCHFNVIHIYYQQFMVRNSTICRAQAIQVCLIGEKPLPALCQITCEN